MIASILLTGLLAIGGPEATESPQPALEEANSVVRRYDLAAYAKAFRHYDGSTRLLSGTTFFDGDDDTEQRWTMEPDFIVDAIQDLLGEEMEYEGRQIWWTDHNQMIVQAPTSVHERIDSILDVFGRAVSSTSSLRVDILEVPGSSALANVPSGVIGLEEVEGLLALAKGHGTETFNAQLSPGCIARLDATSVHPYIGDYHVEVAEGTYCYDPVRINAIAGTRIKAYASPTRSGCDLALLVMHGEPASPIEETRLNLNGQVSTEGGIQYWSGPERLQSIPVSQRTFALNTSIPNGKALVLNSEFSLEQSQGTQIIIVRRVGGPMAQIVSSEFEYKYGELHIIRRDSMRVPHLNLTGRLVDSPLEMERLLQRDFFEWGNLRTDFHTHGSDIEHEILEETYHDLDLRIDDQWMVVYGNQEQMAEHRSRDGFRSELATLVDALAPSSEIVTLSISVERNGEGDSNSIRCTVPVRVGEHSAVVLGVETARVIDYDVEIAAKSSVIDPILGMSLDGMAIVLVPMRSGDGSLSLRMSGGVNLARDGQFFEPRSPSFGVVDEQVYDRLMIDETVTLDSSSNSATVIGNSSSKSDGVRIEVRVL